MPPFDYDQLDAGIRDLVRFVHRANFVTCDSGDGKSKPADERVLHVPHVMIQARPADLVREARRLHELLAREGLAIAEQGPDERQPSIGASYDPANGIALIALTGVDDAMLAAARGDA